MPLYSTPFPDGPHAAGEMRNLFSQPSRVSQFLRVEVALTRVEARLGLIPPSAHEEIARRAKGLKVNWERLRQDLATLGYLGLPLLRQFGEACGSAAEYLHWGEAARDVGDIALLLQIRQGLDLLERDARQLRERLLAMTQAHQSTLMLTRIEGRHPMPTTFGFRCAVWLTELEHQLGRLAAVRAGLVAGQFGGSAGGFSALGPRGLDVQAGLMEELGLEADPVSWCAARDRLTDVMYLLTTLSSNFSCIAGTMLRMSSGGVQELEPQDRAGCEAVMANTRQVMQDLSCLLASTLEDQQHDGYCDFEVPGMPRTFVLVHESLGQVTRLLEGLEVLPSRMRSNIEGTRGLVMADSVMMRLARKSGRRTAHRLIARVCESAVQEDSSLRDALLRSRDITALMSVDEIDAALQPSPDQGCESQIVEQVIAAVQDRLAPSV